MTPLGRRSVVAALVATGIGRPAHAQRAQRRATIGLLVTGSSHHGADALPAELQRLGYNVDGNITFETRYGNGDAQRLATLATELAGLKVDLIVCFQTPAGRAAREATRTIPIVLGPSGAPLETGLVANLSRPGGNITGLSDFSAELGGRRLQVLKEMKPSLRRVGALASTHDLFTQPFLNYMEEPAGGLGLTIAVRRIDGPPDIERGMAELAADGVEAVVIQGIFNPQRDMLLALAARHRLPLVSWDHVMTRKGGLFSMSGSTAQIVRHTALFVDRILQGARPGDLPVEQPTAIEFVLNARTARLFGFALPPSIPAMADEIVE